jgi:hypothetical protein
MKILLHRGKKFKPTSTAMNLSPHKANFRWYFLIIPVILLSIGFLYIDFAGIYFLGVVDPEFCYLFNGIILAHGQPHLNAVGHPGTPIQLLIAIVSPIVHLFRPGTLWDDVMTNPDLYIKSCLYVANVVNAIFLTMTGHYIFKYTRSIVIALVLQLTPFAFLLTLEISYRLMPEVIMPAIISCWIILIVKFLYEEESNRDYKKYSLWFGLLFGFSLANKLTFLPFFVLPIMMISSIKLRLRYVVVAVLTFCLCAFPVLFNFDKFISWIVLLFTHKGMYGKGGEGIIDFSAFLENLKMMAASTRQILIPLFILVVITIIYAVRKRKSNVLIRTSIGLILLVIIQYAITAKHFAFYYMTPSLLMAVFIGFMLYYFLEKMFPVISKKNIPLILFAVFGIIMVINVIPKAKGQLTGLKNREIMKTKAYYELKPFLKDEPKIICPDYFGSSAIEYAMYFGLFESGRSKHTVHKIFKEHYPSTYLYMAWTKDFYDGGLLKKPNDFIHTNSEFTLYVSNNSKEAMDDFISSMQSDSLKYRYQLDELHSLPETNEGVYKLRIGEIDAYSGSTSSAY